MAKHAIICKEELTHGSDDRAFVEIQGALDDLHRIFALERHEDAAGLVNSFRNRLLRSAFISLHLMVLHIVRDINTMLEDDDHRSSGKVVGDRERLLDVNKMLRETLTTIKPNRVLEDDTIERETVEGLKSVIVESYAVLSDSRDDDISELLSTEDLWPEVPRELPDSVVLDGMAKILGMDYELCKEILLDVSMRRDGVKFRPSITELRDFLDHLSFAMLSGERDLGLVELSYASEHLRRATVEALQEIARTYYSAWSNQTSDQSVELNGEMLPQRLEPDYIGTDLKMRSYLIRYRAQKSTTHWLSAIVDLYTLIDLIDEDWEKRASE